MNLQDVEFFPGPGLNLILGPNGSGKSSIVAAICLGLAGKPKVSGKLERIRPSRDDYSPRAPAQDIGRATDQFDYIRRNQEEATVEIELFRAKGNIVIQRILSRASDQRTSVFKINGKKVPENQVRELVTSFNIRLDNLTQFMPQERVAQFASMKPPEVACSVAPSPLTGCQLAC